ncbi:hypothetical protein AC249_AIPGENE3010 [Exaiptasia diaphana]|nr:hypothetical protein AC249_AIPGENE3010 [Exaiptasia diaphana]
MISHNIKVADISAIEDASDFLIEQSHLNHEIETKYLVPNRHYLDTITEPEQYKEITLIVKMVSWVLLIGSNKLFWFSANDY